MVALDTIFGHSCERMPELADDSVALTVTSPPYWNAIDYDIHATDSRQYYRTRRYANGYKDYQDYLEWLTRIFTEVYRVTRPGGFCAIVIGTTALEHDLHPTPHRRAPG
jgi:site-specific DNA-methyltransferase (adenine-specific)